MQSPLGLNLHKIDAVQWEVLCSFLLSSWFRFFFVSVEHAQDSTGRKLELFYSILQAEEWEEVVEESFSEES